MSGPRGRVRYEEFGLESVLRSHSKFIKNTSDVCVVWLHFVLLRNLFKCHGGEGAITEQRTEHLPRNLGWNGERRLYMLKYEYQYRNFGLGIFIRDDEADASLVTLQRSIRIAIPISELVRQDLTIRDAICDMFTTIIEKNFIFPMMKRASTLSPDDYDATPADAFDPDDDDDVQDGDDVGDDEPLPPEALFACPERPNLIQLPLTAASGHCQGQ